MYIEIVPNRGSRPAILLRKGRREGKRTVKQTLANLSDWDDQRIESLRLVLRGVRLFTVDQIFRIERSVAHGHVELVLAMIRKLDLARLIDAKPSRERDLIVAMVAERILAPASKLGTTRLWETSTLPEELCVGGVDVEELYAALDGLLERQPRIEKKLARRHLAEGSTVLYDISSSFYYGHTCPLVMFGHSRDEKKNLPIIVYGVLTDEEGRPVAAEAYKGNTADPKTVPDRVEQLRSKFGLTRVILVGDRGMLTQAQITNLKKYPGLGWISSLRSTQIRPLFAQGALQRSLFDAVNLAEITWPDHPDERLVACFNPLLAEQRHRKRNELLAATERDLDRIRREVERRTKTPLTRSDIGVRAGRVLFRRKMGKHFKLSIGEGTFSWTRRAESISDEERLDGIYVIRTSESALSLPADDAVRHYKSLAHVERAFRCLKGIDLRIRPIFHRKENRVRAHIFLCMLAYYVEWHLRKALAPILFEDEEIELLRLTRDPVAPATPSPSVIEKKKTRQTEDGLPIQSFSSLLALMSTLCRNRCRLASDTTAPPVDVLTDITPLQQRALDLVAAFPVTT